MKDIRIEVLPYVHPFFPKITKTYINGQLKYYTFTFVGNEGFEHALVNTDTEDVYGALQDLATRNETVAAYIQMYDEIQTKYDEIGEMVDQNFALQTVLVSGEIEERWELPKGSVLRDVSRGKFKYNELRKSGGTWLISFGAAVRVYGAPKKSGEYVRPDKLKP